MTEGQKGLILIGNMIIAGTVIFTVVQIMTAKPLVHPATTERVTFKRVTKK